MSILYRLRNKSICTVALPLKGNEFQANHNSSKQVPIPVLAVILPLEGNELQTNHNILMSWPDDIQLNLTDRAISCTVSL